MLFSFESPIDLLQDSLQYNDYDFILFHLLKKYKKYKEFYMTNQDRFSILDNSQYEFYINKKEFKEEEFIEAIKEINPDIYIIPDKLMDRDQTILLFENWILKHSDIPNRRMVVIQGKTFEEWLSCYMYFYEKQEHFDYVGISFHYDFFKHLGKSLNVLKFANEDYYYALGRKYLLKFLVDNDLIMDKMYHLLGSHVGGQEFLWYKNFGYNFIKTIDTGLPIKYGIANINFDTWIGKEKPNIIMDDFINKKMSIQQKELIKNNIINFKETVFKN